MPPHPLANLEIQKYYQNRPKINDLCLRNSFPKLNVMHQYELIV